MQWALGKSRIPMPSGASETMLFWRCVKCSISFLWPLAWLVSRFAWDMSDCAKSFRGAVMTLDIALGGLVAVFLLAYLVFALVRPEKF